MNDMVLIVMKGKEEIIDSRCFWSSRPFCPSLEMASGDVACPPYSNVSILSSCSRMMNTSVSTLVLPLALWPVDPKQPSFRGGHADGGSLSPRLGRLGHIGIVTVRVALRASPAFRPSPVTFCSAPPAEVAGDDASSSSSVDLDHGGLWEYTRIVGNAIHILGLCAEETASPRQMDPDSESLQFLPQESGPK